MTPEARAITALATEAIADERFAKVFKETMNQAADKPSGFAIIVFMLIGKVIEELGPPDGEAIGEQLYGDDSAAEHILGRLHQVSRQVFGVQMTPEEFIATMDKIQDMAMTDPQEQAPEAQPMMAEPAQEAPPQPGLMMQETPA